METSARERVEEQIRQLSEQEIEAVSHFITALRQFRPTDPDEEQRDWLLFAETSLRKDWDTQEEDAAWAHLADLPTW